MRLFEEQNGHCVWEGYGDFQHTNVHKQVAIAFRMPKYRTLDIEQPVKVSFTLITDLLKQILIYPAFLFILQCFIQLKRPSDGITSEPLPFEYLPLDSGRRSFLGFRKGLKEKGNVDFFKQLLSLDDDILSNKPNGDIPKQEQVDQKHGNSINEIIVLDTPNDDELVIEKTEILTVSNDNNEPKIEKTTVIRMDTVDGNDKTTEWLEKAEFVPLNEDSNGGFLRGEVDDDKTLNDLLEQVAELDEIYSDHQTKRTNADIEHELNLLEKSLPRIGNEASMDFDDLFDDTATYTSLQRAFKNPVPIIDLFPPSPPPNFDPNDYDAVEPLAITNPTSPVIDVSPLKRESPNLDEEKLPPLPPKRYRKITGSPENVENQAHIINKQTYMNESAPATPERRNSIKSPSRPQSQIIIMRTPDQSPLNKRLPPTPNSNSNANTLPKQKKSGFFSKLFSRRKSKSDISSSQTDIKISPDLSRESSINHFDFHDQNRLSTRSLKNPSKKQGKPVGRSVSSVSGKRPHLTADIVHIPLKGDSTDSLPIRSGSGNILAGRHSSRITLSNNLDRKTVSALQLADLPIQDGNMELIAIADAQSLKNLCEGAYGVHLDPDVDLTEAEHFALYTSVAPYATQSEFDEASCYYAPVEGGEILTTLEVAQRLSASTQMDLNKN